jgi:two-component system sensor histidine kinase/response regulator
MGADMDDQDKTKEQLIEELEALRAQLAGMEAEHEQTRKWGEALLDVIVHDARTPLTFVIGLSELATGTVETGEPDLAELTECLSRSRDAAERAINLLESVQRTFQFVFGDRPLNLTSFALGEVVGQVQAEFQSEADDNDIELTFAAPEEAEPVLADEEIVRRVVKSMLDFALRVTAREGQVSIEVKPVPEGQQVSMVFTGPVFGLDDAHKRIYGPIGREMTGIPRPRKGGELLGLTFCKLAIEAHGGRVWAETMPKGGVALHFILPAKQV